MSSGADSRQDDVLRSLIDELQANVYGGHVQFTYGGDDGWDVQWYEAHPGNDVYLREWHIEGCPQTLEGAIREALAMIWEARS